VTDRTKPLTAADTSFVEFVESAWQRHLRLAVLLTGDRSQAEELLQDSLVRMYERWRKLSRLDDLNAYLRRSLVNNHTSNWRRRRRESLVAEVPDRVSAVAAGGPDPEVRQALMALPAGQRAVVVLRLYEDLSERQTAAALGCSVGNVKSQYVRALDKLRALVRGTGTWSSARLRCPARRHAGPGCP
jgi:RNA polymerase sigma-70 factor (sigma-E family)